MNEQKRMLIMLGVVGALVVANLFMYMGEDSFDSGLFGDELEAGLTGRAAMVVNELERLPRLDFDTNRSKEEPDVISQRNPFIFGVDRAKEKERQQRMEELRQAREEIEVVKEPEPVVERATFDGRLIGIMSGQGKRMVSVSLDQEIHILHEGDELKNRYRLVGVNQEQVTFLHLATGEEIHIKLETK